MKVLIGCLGVLLAAALPGAATAHALAPSVLSLQSEMGGALLVTWRYSLRDPGAAALQPRFPADCRRVQAVQPSPSDAGFKAHRWRLDCSAADAAASVRIAGLANGPRSVLLRYVESDAVHTRLLDGRRSMAPLWPDAAVSAAATARDYLELGVEHLLLGPDHLLFVVGLFLLVRRKRRLLAVTLGFTLGHSLTLAASVLGYLQLPQALTEWGIAASLVWLAWRVLRRGDDDGGSTLRLVTAAGAFGLLHGLGFAGALAAIGLPESQLWLALAAFNIGIELGQLVVICALLGIALAQRGAWPNLGTQRFSVAAGYAVGTMGAFWCIDRGLLLLPAAF